MNEQKEAIERALNEVVSNQTANELAYMDSKTLETAYYLLQEQMNYQKLLPQELTVSGVLQGLYDLTQADFQERLSIEEYQEILYQQVDQLANLLGFELDEVE